MPAAEYSVLSFDVDSCNALMDILTPFDKFIKKRVDLVQQKGYKLQESLEYVITQNPVLWAKVYLNWEPRDYQIPILEEGRKSKKLVLRLGRRLGKTDSMCILILWFAYNQINKGPNNQYDILIMTPYETQIDLIFKRLKQLIAQSPVLQSLLVKDVEHKLAFDINGVVSEILGLTAGANNSAGGANSSRGQRADVIILDEVDYIGSSQITNVINIRNEAPERIRMICASTPSGKHEEYYNWCTNASKSYSVKQEDIDNFEFSEYIVTEKPAKEGNGWTEVYAPSVVNKELLKINPDTEQTYLQDIKDELSEMRYDQEVMANFGEELAGVYQKKYLEMAIAEGNRIGHVSYITDWSKEDRDRYLHEHPSNLRYLGVDWDKYGAATNMVCVEYDRYHTDENGRLDPKFKILFRVEIPRSEFTYTNAMQKIVELDEEYDFEYIAVDRGYGETQIELLHKYGIENPKTGFSGKVIGYQFKENVEVMDPYTRKKDKKPLKPFMVNNSVNLFEKGGIILNPKDKDLKKQLEDYRIKSISSSGLPVYSSENEHAIDAMNLCLLVFAQKHSELLRKVYTGKINFIGTIDNRSVDVKSRALTPQDEAIALMATPKSIRNVNGDRQVIYPLGVSNRGTTKARNKNVFNRKKF